MLFFYSWARYASQKDIDKLSADKVEEVLKQGDMDGHEVKIM